VDIAVTSIRHKVTVFSSAQHSRLSQAGECPRTQAKEFVCSHALETDGRLVAITRPGLFAFVAGSLLFFFVSVKNKYICVSSTWPETACWHFAELGEAIHPGFGVLESAVANFDFDGPARQRGMINGYVLVMSLLP
jgi:hypothetical protein